MLRPHASRGGTAAYKQYIPAFGEFFKVPSFGISDLQQIELLLSLERMRTYHISADGGIEEAFALYIWNMRMAEAFNGPLHVIEVILRNALGGALKRKYGQDWYLPGKCFHLSGSQVTRLSEAVAQVVRQGRLLAHGRVVAELSFGFWSGLLGNRYENSLWRHLFYGEFRHAPKPLRRAAIQRPVDELRFFRNRIAHHEPIFQRDLAADYARILMIARWISPTAESWIEATSREKIELLLERRPQLR